MLESTEKIHKSFADFEKEERWLQAKVNEGWLLVRYHGDIEEGTYYTFEKVDLATQRNRVYKIDFREFDAKEEYEEYIEMFTESGWTPISTKNNSKHIFYSESQNAIQHIFSDKESYKDREKRMIQSALKNTVIYFGFLIISIIIYILFDKNFAVGAGLFSALAMIKSFISYMRHKQKLNKMSMKVL